MCGSGAVVATGCNTHTRVATAEAARSRRASRASRVVVVVHDGAATAPREPPDPQRWIGSTSRQGKEPERSVHRGSCGAGFKHRARDVGEMADLRHCQNERCLIERCRSASVSRETEARGSVQDPGVPRRPHFRGDSRLS